MSHIYIYIYLYVLYFKVIISYVTVWKRARKNSNKLYVRTCLLIAGDVVCNSNLKYCFPCTLCYKPVKCNQQDIECSKCLTWTHHSCCKMPLDTQYSIHSVDWLCLGCMCVHNNICSTLFVIWQSSSRSFSDVFSKLDSKSKARYQEKVSYIAQEDPYLLKDKDFMDNMSFLPDLR